MAKLVKKVEEVKKEKADTARDKKEEVADVEEENHISYDKVNNGVPQFRIISTDATNLAK